MSQRIKDGGPKHTPGPWYIYEGNPHWIMAVDPHDDTPWHVAKIEPHAGPGNATPSNARLISAAPDLLAALQAIVASLSEQDEEGLIEHAEQMIAARAAVSKATGGSS